MEERDENGNLERSTLRLLNPRLKNLSLRKERTWEAGVKGDGGIGELGDGVEETFAGHRGKKCDEQEAREALLYSQRGRWGNECWTNHRGVVDLE